MKEYEDIYIKEDDNIKFCFTKRELDAKNIDDIKFLCEKYKFNYDAINSNEQIHSSKVVLVENSEKNLSSCQGDALITNLKKTPLLIYTADCVPLVFYDKDAKVVALAHAGWRGTYEDIGIKTVEKMITEYGAKLENIKAIIGPSISVDNYEVSKELIDKFAKLKVDNYYKKLENNYYLDLWSINKERLKFYGIDEKNIKIMDLCTVRNNDEFYSYRLDQGTTKRIGTLIQID